ncbi:MFS transporter [Agromyces indicus]|uniref:MFS transporter n=1 Tax=Agromyces indicus TaxID=758919 RepID=A0ABU1FL27_9MICO|nr:MFS transporter [Agromyces indicus]MDR5692453.1 MFS transporter [Agromyces indicus]
MPITSSSRVAATPTAALPWKPLIALASAVFLSITIEMIPMGLLPEMSADLGVGEPLVGLLVSVFAFAVVVTSAPLTALTRRMPRRTLLTAVLVLLGLTSIASALVPEYWMLVAVRVLGGVAHGVFWALVGAYPARLVAHGQLGRAVSTVLGGGTIALIAGVPISTALGQALGWRPVFVLVGVLTLAGALVVRAVLPTDAAAPAAIRPATGSTAAIRVSEAGGMAAVLAVCVVTAVVMIGQYAALTYVAPILTDVVGAAPEAVAPLLFASGLAGAAGLVVAGSPIARNSVRALVVAMTAIAIALVVMAAEPGLWPAVIAYTAWGFAFGAVPPLLQTRLLQAAPPERRDAASALYTTAFNIGIGGGALLGGLLFGAFGVGAVPLAYAVMLVAASVIVVVSSTRAAAGRARVAAATGSITPSA